MTNLFVVFIGGGMGAMLRYLFSILIPKENAYIPYHTLAVNFLGCFIAGIVVTYFVLKSDINPVYKSLIITGFCGRLTTFSTFSLEIVEFLQQGDFLKAIIYIFTSLSICLISVILGVLLVKKYV